MKKHSIEYIQSLAQLKGGMLLSSNYSGMHEKLEWQCAEGHKWWAMPANIRSGKWCPGCSKYHNRDPQKHMKTIRKIAAEKGGRCLSDKYISNTTKLLWECASGHQWEARPADIKRGIWCSTCFRGKYITEQKCRYVFETIYGCPFYTTKTVLPDRLELDGYNELLNMAFEYQGEQHYEYIPLINKTRKRFEEQKIRDHRKRKICEELGIRLIIIPYWEAESDEDLVGYICSKTSNNSHEIDWKTFYSTCPTMVQLQNLAKNKGGRLLSTEYKNMNSKLTWECSHKHKWEAVPASIKYGDSWCPACFNLKRRKNETAR